MKKTAVKKAKKATTKRDFEKEYFSIMKGIPSLPIPEWRNPGDSFVKLSMYNQHSSIASSNSTN
jgi:hypothetical protein